ncbi:MAG: Amuc_1099 family pilus-like system protein, partial [Verrucomicrobiota bacterium]
MNSSAWDKFILIAVAIVVIGLSGLFIAKSLAYGDRFQMESVSPDNELEATDIARAKGAMYFVATTQEWEDARKGDPPKPVPLFVSITIVESGGKLIDMLDPNAPLLRPPVSNAWLINDDLDYLNSGVLTQDPDRDGFSNIEEWEGKTDPNDPNSHPPYADKLRMLSRQQTEYKLRFVAKPDSERFQIQRVPTVKWPQADNFYMRVGETSDDGQFRLDSFEEMKELNN